MGLTFPSSTSYVILSVAPTTLDAPQTTAYRDAAGNILIGVVATTSLTASGTTYHWTAYQDGGVWQMYRNKILTGTVLGSSSATHGGWENWQLEVATGPLGWGVLTSMFWLTVLFPSLDVAQVKLAHLLTCSRMGNFIDDVG